MASRYAEPHLRGSCLRRHDTYINKIELVIWLIGAILIAIVNNRMRSACKDILVIYDKECSSSN